MPLKALLAKENGARRSAMLMKRTTNLAIQSGEEGRGGQVGRTVCDRVASNGTVSCRIGGEALREDVGSGGKAL